MKFDIHVVFAGGQEVKIFRTVFRDLGKYMLGKGYFQHWCYSNKNNSDVIRNLKDLKEMFSAAYEIC